VFLARKLIVQLKQNGKIILIKLKQTQQEQQNQQIDFNSQQRSRFSPRDIIPVSEPSELACDSQIKAERG
jgi:hypothetical protein